MFSFTARYQWGPNGILLRNGSTLENGLDGRPLAPPPNPSTYMAATASHTHGSSEPLTMSVYVHLCKYKNMNVQKNLQMGQPAKEYRTKNEKSLDVENAKCEKWYLGVHTSN